MRLRQVVLVARDLDAVVGDVCAGLGIAVSFNDPGVAFFGLRNAVTSAPVSVRSFSPVSVSVLICASSRPRDSRRSWSRRVSC